MLVYQLLCRTTRNSKKKTFLWFHKQHYSKLFEENKFGNVENVLTGTLHTTRPLMMYLSIYGHWYLLVAGLSFFSLAGLTSFFQIEIIVFIYCYLLSGVPHYSLSLPDMLHLILLDLPAHYYNLQGLHIISYIIQDRTYRSGDAGSSVLTGWSLDRLI